MIKCVSNKKVYPSEEIAEDALIDTWSRFEYPNGQGPIAVYRCEECGYYHFTSKGTLNQKLAKVIKEGKLARNREANHWENKLKRK